MIARRTLLVVVIGVATVWAFGIGSVAAQPASPVPTAHVAPAGPAATPAAASSSSAAPANAATSFATNAPTMPSHSSRLSVEQKILATAKADHLSPMELGLPNLLGQPRLANGVVSPSYPTSPAPMGLATYGVMNTTGTPTAYSIETMSWEGTITINSLSTFLLDNDAAISTNGADNSFGIQLNAVTNGTTLQATSSYAFWTQNVLFFNAGPGLVSEPGYLTFIDNVWNFSSPAFDLSPGTIHSGNGTPVYPVYYYDIGPSFQYTLPLTVHLYLNSSTTDDPTTGFGYTTVRFGYDIVNANTGVSEAQGVYDTVEFNSTTPYASVPASPYLVDGSQLTPTGFIPYDAEIMIGGPGGGTTTSVYKFSGTASLMYLPGGGIVGVAQAGPSNAYEAPASAWNVASETGETIEGLSVTYTTPGVVDLSAGPSIPMPLWGATPGGNLGEVDVAASVDPSNAFVFFTPGDGFDPNFADWAPTQTADWVHYVVAPGTYTIDAMLSDWAPIQLTLTAAHHSVVLHFDLDRDVRAGVYTPLFAWQNHQYRAISFGGDGSPGRPYQIVNNPAPGGINPVFAQYNDYLFPVFPGVQFVGTSAHVDLNNPSIFAVAYSPTFAYSGILTECGVPGSGCSLPYSNHLQFELFDASNVAIWHAQGITGWFFWEDYGPTGFLPLANVVIWGGVHDLVGASTFVSQGSSLLLAGSNPAAPTDNVVWGNTFVNSTVLSPGMYPGNATANGPPIAIFAFESGDLIYNNWIGTSITAFSPDANLFYGSPQLNVENWNLPIVVPRDHTMWFDGYPLDGTIVPSKWQGGNFWIDYVPELTPLPYDEYGFIAEGGDYFPLPITGTEVIFTLHGDLGAYHGVSPVVWTVTVNGVTETSHARTIDFFEAPGTYTFSVLLVHGKGSITPLAGTLDVDHHAVNVNLYYQNR